MVSPDNCLLSEVLDDDTCVCPAGQAVDASHSFGLISSASSRGFRLRMKVVFAGIPSFRCKLFKILTYFITGRPQFQVGSKLMLLVALRLKSTAYGEPLQGVSVCQMG